ncbi:MAG: cytidine deaminase [Bacteroidota bacterium]
MKTTKREREELARRAAGTKSHAYAPYSQFHVGAALLTESGEIFEGCNVENSSYSLTICAERNAVFQAVMSGHTSFRSIAISSDDHAFLSPCGACRQVLSEFSPSMEIILTDSRGRMKIVSLNKLHPMPADLKMLARSSKRK